MAKRGFSCALCKSECRKRDVVCAGCWKGLSKVRQEAIARAPYSRQEKNRKFLNMLLTCDVKTINQVVAENTVTPGAVQVDEDVEAVFTEINPS